MVKPVQPLHEPSSYEVSPGSRRIQEVAVAWCGNSRAGKARSIATLSIVTILPLVAGRVEGEVVALHNCTRKKVK